MTELLRNKRFLIVLASVIGLVGATAAYAYFTSSGSGSGTAAVGTDAGVSVNTVAFTGTLYPGASVPVSYKVTNLSAQSPAKVGQVIADTSKGTGGISGLPANCLAADFTYTPGPALNTDIAASATISGAGTLAMANTNINQDACKNAAPVLNLIVSNIGL